MNRWIAHPTTLYGTQVDLLPLEETHFPALIALAAEQKIWEFYTVDGWKEDRMTSELEDALHFRDAGRQYPFVIFHKKEKRIIGSTRLTELQPRHRKLEIGWTWLHPDYWASGINTECKLLLLTCCFEQLGTLRVQLRTDVLNIRSQKAIEKIGGRREGIFRNDMIRDNGSHRDSVYFSIISTEWPAVKARLTQESAPVVA